MIVRIHIFGLEINFDVILKYCYPSKHVQVSDILIPHRMILLNCLRIYRFSQKRCRSACLISLRLNDLNSMSWRSQIMKFLITKKNYPVFFHLFSLPYQYSSEPQSQTPVGDRLAFLHPCDWNKFFWDVTLCRWASCYRLSDQFHIITAIIGIVSIIIIIIIIVQGYGFYSLRLDLLDLEDALDHSILVLVPLSQPVRSPVKKTGWNWISSA